jgi:phosphatidylserine/phosphatidylglycerophosphate/cardiolipin synthase-like enzyme
VTTFRRTVRTNPRLGLKVNELISAALVSELLEPSRDLWLVSPWISDIAVLDNRDQHLDPVLGDLYVREVYLSEVLAMLARGGSTLHVAVRPDEHNTAFLERLERNLGEPLDLHRGDDLHEKTLCGDEWVITGSMNFTWNGLAVNDEAVTYTVDRKLAAQTRLDLEHRWLRSV